jgi:hypothetical protein
MSVTTTSNRIAYDGDAVSTVFSFPYKFLASGDLEVYVDDVLQVITTDYTVGTPGDSGANVTFVSAPPVGDNNVVIVRDVDLLQNTDLPSNGPFPSVSVETMVDKVTMQVQRIRDLLSRAFTLPDSDTSGASTELPTPVASNVIGWASDGLSLQNYTTEDFATVAASGNPITNLFSGTGAQTDFTLSAAPVSLPNLEVFLFGVRQSPGVDYTLSGTTLTFLVAPGAGTDNILARWVTAIASPVTVSDGAITTEKIADGAVTATKFAAGSVSTAKLADGAVTTAKLADGSVTQANLAAALREVFASVQDFRLTLTSGTPVTTSDVTGATTIYCAPYKGNSIALFDGTNWNVRTSDQFSLALGTLTSGRPYDVFCYDNAGVPTLEFTSWTNATTRATSLVYQDGVLVKSGAVTRRYLGTFYTTATTTTEDSAAKRFLWNYYNRVDRQLLRRETAASWTYTTGTVRQANANTANQVDMVIGVSEDAVSVNLFAFVNNASNTNMLVGLGLDGTTINIGQGGAGFNNAGGISQLSTQYYGLPGVGRHFITWLESSTATGTTTWYGNNTALGGTYYAGLSGLVKS